MPELIIVVRQSPDWSSMTPDLYLAQLDDFCRSVDHSPELVRQIVELWNGTFETTFFQARQRMKDIAIENWKRVKDARVIESSEGLKVRDLDADFICFVDDDDWFCPDLAERLASARVDGCEGFTWRHAAFGRHEGPGLIIRKDIGYVYTNSYAVVSTFIKKSANNLSRVFQHTAANDAFPTMAIVEIREVLSATNKHPSSIMFLEQSLRGDIRKQRLQSSINAYSAKLRQADSPEYEEVSWAMSSMAQVAEYFSALRPIDRHHGATSNGCLI